MSAFNDLTVAGVAVASGLIGLAALAVFFSPNAKTSEVIKAASGGLAQNIGMAVSPVSGASMGFSQLGNGL